MDWLKIVKSLPRRGPRFANGLSGKGGSKISRRPGAVVPGAQALRPGPADIDPEVRASVCSDATTTRGSGGRLYAALGYGGLNAVLWAGESMKRLLKLREKEMSLAEVEVIKGKASETDAAVMVKGVENILGLPLAAAANLPGDIVGYVTRAGALPSTGGLSQPAGCCPGALVGSAVGAPSTKLFLWSW